MLIVKIVHTRINKTSLYLDEVSYLLKSLHFYVSLSINTSRIFLVGYQVEQDSDAITNQHISNQELNGYQNRVKKESGYDMEQQ